MANLGEWQIDDTLVFACNTHTAATGAATDADGAPAYRIFENETATPLLTGTMALLDGDNTTGFYSEQVTLSAANGFEEGKCYTVYISAAVAGVTGTMNHTFQVEAAKATAAAVADVPTVTEFEARTLAAASYFDPATDLVKLHGTQGAVTFGQVKITASVAGEGALHITNAGADSIGLYAQGAGYGQHNTGAYSGQYNEADGANSSGQRNESSGSNGSGQYNYASASGGSGQYLYGVSSGLTVGNSGGDEVSPMWAKPGDIPAAGAVADAVWDETLADHLGAGSTGAGLNAAGSAGDPWATTVPGAYGSGTAGKILGDNLNATVGSRATQTSVDDVPTNSELATALAGADDATLAAIGALNNLSAAQVNAEVVDVLRTDTIPDSYSADGAQPTLAQAVLEIRQFMMERGVTGTTVTVNKPDGTTSAMTFTLDDDTEPTSITRAS